MARKSRDERSGQERRAAPRTNRRTIERDDDATQLLERGESPPAEEEVFRAERREEGRRQSNTGPRSRRKSDESLRQEIREILTADPELEATDIEVEVEGGAVTLRGGVVDPDARLLAEELVESLSGVREVHNRLKVEREED